MTKEDLAKLLAQDCGESKETCKKVLESFIVVVPKQLKFGHQIYLRGFGTFCTVQRAEKTARNITTGAKVVVPAHRELKLKFSKEVKKG